MTIFLALNEEFKAPVRMLNIPDFNQKVQSLTGDRPANQTVIRKEFEVHDKYNNNLQCIAFVDFFSFLKASIFFHTSRN